MTAPKPDMAALQKALDEAIEAKRQADKEESFARSRTTDAINRLNAAQNLFDAGVESIRTAGAAAGSDWQVERRREVNPSGRNHKHL